MPMDFSRLTPDVFLELGTGLLSGGTWNQQLANAARGANNALQANKAKQEEAAQQNKTIELLKQQSPELVTAIENKLMTPTDAYKMWYAQKLEQQQMEAKRKLEAERPKNDWMSLGDGRLFNKDTREFMTAPVAPGQTDNIKRSLNPIWGIDPTTKKRAIGTLGEDGKFYPVQVPDNFEPTPGVSNIDLGTEWGIRDNKSGEILKTVPKNVAGVEAEKVKGKLSGEAIQQLPVTIAKADQTIATIDKALQHPGRGTGTGLSSVLDPRNYLPGTDAADFQAVQKQLAGRAFLEAFESLKGGGQITEIEGQKAQEAIARLNTSQSDEAYAEALLELRGIVEAGKRRAMETAKGAGVDTTTIAPTNEGVTKGGLKFTVEQ